MFRTHELGQLVVDDLDHHLLRLDGGEDIGPHGLGLDLVAEVLGHLVRDVGIEQRTSDFLEGLGHVDFRDLALALEYLERPFQSVG